MRRFLLAALLGPGTVGLGAAGCSPVSVSSRSLHYMGDELVYSRPVPERAYEAYLRSRILMAQDPPALPEALGFIRVAIRFDPREPHLWTTRAEIEAESGDRAAAMASAKRALQLRPAYPPARSVMARLQTPDRATAAVPDVRP